MDTDSDVPDSQAPNTKPNGEPASDQGSDSAALPIYADTIRMDTDGAATVPVRSSGTQLEGLSYAQGDLFLGKYEIESVIGTGGMGTVVLARHRELGADYAIKFMRSSELDHAAVDRFKREAKMGAMLDHPNVVRVFDCGEQDGQCYIVMEYVQGESLRQRLDRVGRFPVDEVVRFAGIVCSALAMMHDRGITHRDLKPDNIIFQQRPEEEVVKILDFGIAKLASAAGVDQLTAKGIIMGTPVYMSPEQCEARDIDGRSDIYTLGVILFEMLTGEPPFVADNQLTTMYMHVNQPPPLAHAVDPSVPPAVSEVVQRMLAKSPADRYQTAASCAQALADASGVAIEVPRRKVSRAAIGYTAAGVLAVLILGATIWSSLHKSAEPQQAQAPAAAPTALVDVDGMRYIPGGTFSMGSNTGDEYARPAHEVTVAPFYMDTTEVTNQQYSAFLQGRPEIAPPSDWSGRFYKAGTADMPVVNVSWYDALAYAEWAGKRLPTEEEWEYAARGTDGRLYPWGNTWDSGKAFTKKSGVKKLQPVGSLPAGASPFGILDMSGNAWEWCSSNFALYPGSTVPAKDLAFKVIRGGAIGDDEDKATTTYRNWVPPDRGYEALGFRCVKSAEPR
jgi:serine/threonine-protein kinase